MATINLMDLLTSGDFAGLRLGQTSAQILEVFGAPESKAKTIRRKHYDDWWVYGSVEFFFGGKHEVARAISIKTDPWPPVGSGDLEIETAGLGPDLGLSSFLGRMREEGQEFAQDDSLVLTGEAKAVRSMTGAEVYFCADEDTRPKIFCIRRAIDFREGPPIKQVSVSLPEEVYERIRQKSVKERRSIAKICSSWILENLEELMHDQNS